MTTVEQVVDLIGRSRFAHLDERGLQVGLADALTFAAINWRREVRLTARDRIDFMVGRVGIELKVGGSTPSLRRQLVRYAKTGLVDELLVVSTHAVHAALDGTLAHHVPVRVVKPSWM